MATVTNDFLAMLVALIVLYAFMYKHPTRWVRMAGCFAIIITSIGLGIIEDSIPMYILMMVNLMIAGLRFIQDVSQLTDLNNKDKTKIRW